MSNRGISLQGKRGKNNGLLNSNATNFFLEEKKNIYIYIYLKDFCELSIVIFIIKF